MPSSDEQQGSGQLKPQDAVVTLQEVSAAVKKRIPEALKGDVGPTEMQINNNLAFIEKMIGEMAGAEKAIIDQVAALRAKLEKDSTLRIKLSLGDSAEFKDNTQELKYTMFWFKKDSSPFGQPIQGTTVAPHDWLVASIPDECREGYLQLEVAGKVLARAENAKDGSINLTSFDKRSDPIPLPPLGEAPKPLILFLLNESAEKLHVKLARWEDVNNPKNVIKNTEPVFWKITFVNEKGFKLEQKPRTHEPNDPKDRIDLSIAPAETKQLIIEVQGHNVVVLNHANAIISPSRPIADFSFDKLREGGQIGMFMTLVITPHSAPAPAPNEAELEAARKAAEDLAIHEGAATWHDDKNKKDLDMLIKYIHDYQEFKPLLDPANREHAQFQTDLKLLVDLRKSYDNDDEGNRLKDVFRQQKLTRADVVKAMMDVYTALKTVTGPVSK